MVQARQRGRRTGATAAACGAGRPARAQWPATSKTPGGVGDLGDDGDGDEEDEDRPDPLGEVGEVRAVTPARPPRSAAETSRTQGCPVRAGACSVTSKRCCHHLRQRLRRTAGPRPPRRGGARRGRGCAWPCAWRRGRGPAPSARRARPAGPTPRHTCWSGSRRSTPRRGRLREHVGAARACQTQASGPSRGG